MPVSFSIADSSDGPRKVVIWVTGDLDADTSRAVRARLAQAKHHPLSDVILDLTGVTFVDSAGLTAIVSGAKGLASAGQFGGCAGDCRAPGKRRRVVVRGTARHPLDQR